MADRSRRSSTELELDLSTPTAPKKAKQSETEESPVEEDPMKLESGTETPSTSGISSQTETTPVRQGKEKEEISESAEASKQSTSEASLSSAETSLELSEQRTDTAATSTEATPGSSLEEEFGPLQTIVMRYSSQQEDSGSSGRTAEATVQIQASLLGDRSSYEELSLIGNGAYGTVYKARDRVSGQIVAIKKLRVTLTDDGLPQSTMREIATLKQLERYEHPHIVRLLDICLGNYFELPSGERSGRLYRHLTVWLVFEHLERDLASYIASCPRTGIPPYLVRQMSKEILCGVEFLHTNRIIHRDLKPQNLLVTRDGRIKIADFGLAKTYDFEMRLTSVVVTQWYRAPEVLLGCSYATPVDIWSVGCIIAELYKLEPLFPGTSEGDQLDRIFQVVGTPSQQAWPENVSLSWTAFPHRQPRPLGAIIPDVDEHGLDLIKNMLMFDPRSRITAAKAAKHRHFSEDDA